MRLLPFDGRPMSIDRPCCDMMRLLASSTDGPRFSKQLRSYRRRDDCGYAYYSLGPSLAARSAMEST